MHEFSPLRSLPEKSPYSSKDVLVLFGELFPGGYANGLVNGAKKRGMKIIYSTVGRRDKDPNNGQSILRPLNAEELETCPQPLINIPLEAGCDMEPSLSGPTPIEQMGKVKMSDWQQVELDWQQIEQSRERANERFKNNTEAFFSEIEPHIAPGSHVLFAHLMAGGVPRAKISMPIMNRVFKGQGDRHIPSQDFYESDLGKFSLFNFKEVTSGTLKHLLTASKELKNKIESNGGHVNYVAYGYHGTEILVKEKFTWQTYTPYFQGWAKRELEDIAYDFSSKSGTQISVFNCPEILTNSSSVFNGVELSLYPFLGALSRYKENPYIKGILDHCFSRLKDDVTLDQILSCTDDYMTSDLTQEYSQFDLWPQSSGREQMEQMLSTSSKLKELHKDPKQLITFRLSELIFETCGEIMLDKSWALEKPVWWLGHDLLSQCASNNETTA